VFKRTCRPGRNCLDEQSIRRSTRARTSGKVSPCASKSSQVATRLPKLRHCMTDLCNTFKRTLRSRVMTITPRSAFMRPKGSAEKLETRRRLAANLLAKGQGIREVARTIGAAPSSVKRWKDALEQGGKNALKSKPHTGRPSRLSPKQRQRLLYILQKGPRAANLRADQWTCSRIGTVIRRCFGVKYHPDHVSRILRALGWKFQRENQQVKKQGMTDHTNLRWANLSRRKR
jgi:transposase